ncbi:DUF2059 domain-containing protein [Xanthobacter sp. NFM-26]|uniref:DUF2059 domain-containing protein n=2 Tax=unclassified Xanthobacter TaxID=2623496 RepID=UPI001EE08F8E
MDEVSGFSEKMMRISRFAHRGVGAFVAAAVSVSVLAGASFGASSAWAQQAAAPSAAQMALAKDLVMANGEARAFDGVIANIVDGAALSFLSTNPDLAKQLRDVAIALRPEFEKRQPEILQILASAYAARFSESELKEALAFYRTPTGKKLVADRPAIVQQAVQGIQGWGAQVNAEAVERVRAEMKKKGFDL